MISEALLVLVFQKRAFFCIQVMDETLPNEISYLSYSMFIRLVLCDLDPFDPFRLLPPAFFPDMVQGRFSQIGEKFLRGLEYRRVPSPATSKRHIEFPPQRIRLRQVRERPGGAVL